MAAAEQSQQGWPVGPAAEAVVARDRRVISPSYPRAYPLVVDHGQGAWVWDVDGRKYLDFCAGIGVVATGHAHPRVVAAIEDQARRFLHMSGSDFYYPPMVELAERLAAIAPGAFAKRVFFANSGAEAVEAAVKLARYHTGRRAIVAFHGAFHGRTYGAMSLTASKVGQRRGFGPLLPDVYHVPYGYCYRCAYRLRYPQCGIACVDAIEESLLHQLVAPDEVAAVVVEPVQGEGGYVVPPPEFHRRLKALCERHGILFVADEVQSGMGRTGRMFAIEHFGVEPDILVVAKGIASGMPLSAIVARAELMDWPPGAHGSTFGGNPVSCAAALATLDLLQEGLVQQAGRVGGQILARLREMARQYPLMGDVRGLGLMIGVEFVRPGPGGTPLPAPDLARQVVREAFARGLLVLEAGASTVRISPPLVLTEAEADDGLQRFEAAVATVAKTAGIAVDT